MDRQARLNAIMGRLTGEGKWNQQGDDYLRDRLTPNVNRIVSGYRYGRQETPYDRRESRSARQARGQRDRFEEYMENYLNGRVRNPENDRLHRNYGRLGAAWAAHSGWDLDNENPNYPREFIETSIENDPEQEDEPWEDDYYAMIGREAHRRQLATLNHRGLMELPAHRQILRREVAPVTARRMGRRAGIVTEEEILSRERKEHVPQEAPSVPVPVKGPAAE